MFLNKQKIQYLTFDSIEEGVGSSQVLAYLNELSSKHEIRLINFEKKKPLDSTRKKLEDLGIEWIPLDFGRFGFFFGFARVCRLVLQLDPKVPIHARGDLAAFSAIISGNRRVLWDCRALHADQRLALSTSKGKYLVYALNRLIEYVVAKKSFKVNTITFKAARILQERYQLTSDKFSVISTCVNTKKFTKKAMPEASCIKVLIPGTFSSAYDIDLMNRIFRELRKRINLEVTVAVGKGADQNWRRLDYDITIQRNHDEMPTEIGNAHFGMSIWRANLGICLASVSSTKIPEFLAVGRPVIANFNQGEIGELLSTFRCGVGTSLNSEEYIRKYAEEIIELIRDPGIVERCHELAERYFSLEGGIRTLESVYSNLRKLS